MSASEHGMSTGLRVPLSVEDRAGIRAELDQLREWQRRNAWRNRTVQHDANDRHTARLESMLKEDA